jgi:surface protein
MMFNGCANLTKIDISGWDTSKVTTTWLMFNACSGLTVVDMSGWSTPNLKSTHSMFKMCSNLETVYVSESWTTASVNSSQDMFTDCTSLQGGAGTAFDPAKTNKEYARIDDPDNGKPGYFTHISAKPADPEQNQ